MLRLVAAGRSNPEIAAQLFISPKTASVHVSNILAKMGVTSRGEAAAAAHRQGLFDGAASPRGASAVPGQGRTSRPLPASTLLTGVPIGHSWHVEQWNAWEVGI